MPWRAPTQELQGGGTGRARPSIIPANCRAANSSAWRWPAPWRRARQILFADEPTGNLDSANGAAVADLLFALQAERGATLFLVTHEESLARRCGRIVRLKDGADRDGRKNSDPGMSDLALAWKLARREMRGGLSGFRIFFLCLLLGIAAIAGVGSLIDAFLTGLRDQGQVLPGRRCLGQSGASPGHGGGACLSRPHGTVSATTSMRAMAYALRDGKQAERKLVELKAVDDPGRCTARPLSSRRHSVADAHPLRERRRFAAPPPSRHCWTGCMSTRRSDPGGQRHLPHHRRLADKRARPYLHRLFSLGPACADLAKALAAPAWSQPGSLIDYSYRVAFTPGASPSPVSRPTPKPLFPTPAGRSATATMPRPASAALSNR